ncbi:MAG: bacteriohemerythrin [Spirochaetales bacterium]|nr:bacteriohemerythrin [Spirochaetales bacterium]
MLALIGLILLIGTFGYPLIEEGWTLLDGFYMTAISITTVGFGETLPLSSWGRVFTIFIIFAGIGAAAVFASQLAQAFLESHFQQYFGGARMNKIIGRLKGHYIVCGFGGIGSSICSELDEAGVSFVVVEKREDYAKWAKQRRYLTVIGEATYDSTLIEAGIERASGLVTDLGDDSTNMYVTLAVKELNPSLYVIARGYKDDAESRLLRAGADRVVYPLQMGGRQVARLIEDRMAGREESAGESAGGRAMGHSLRIYNNETHGLQIKNLLSRTGALRVLSVETPGQHPRRDPPVHDTILEGDRVLLLMRDAETLHQSDEANGDYESHDENLFQWSEAYLLGVKAIDEEHRKLFEITSEFVRAVKSNLSPSHLSRIFDRLISYTAEHFENEEALHSQYNYPQKEAHKEEHRRLSEKVLRLNKERNYVFSTEVEGFLFSWLKNHILESDQKFANFLTEQKTQNQKIQNIP